MNAAARTLRPPERGRTQRRSGGAPERRASGGCLESKPTSPLSPAGTVALAYAARGWPVLPLKPGDKVPASEHGCKDATTDAARIESWWSRRPRCNIGIATGPAFDALDIDGPEALWVLDNAMPKAVAATDDPVIIGPTVRTPRGWHVYLAPTGRGNSVNVGGSDGVDWRGKGGYVVAPGSLRADGARWSWYLPGDPLYGPDAAIEPAPDWLLDLRPTRSPVTTSSLPTGRRSVASPAYALAALERACGRLATTTPGNRNDSLNREAYGLGRLVRSREMTAGQAGDALLRVAAQIGLDEAGARATIRSGLEAGIDSSCEVAS